MLYQHKCMNAEKIVFTREVTLVLNIFIGGILWGKMLFKSIRKFSYSTAF